MKNGLPIYGLLLLGIISLLMTNPLCSQTSARKVATRLFGEVEQMFEDPDVHLDNLIAIAERSLSLFEQSSCCEEEKGKLNYHLGKAYRNKANFELAIEHLEQAKSYCLKTIGPNSVFHIQILDEWAFVYQKKAEFEKMADLLNQARNISKRVSLPPVVQANLYSNIGLYHYDQKETFDSSAHFFRISIDILEAEKNTLLNKLRIAANYHNLARYEGDKGNIQKAVELTTKAIEIKEDNFISKSLTSNYLNLGFYYKKLGDYERAVDAYLKGVALEKKTQKGKTRIGALLNNNLGICYRRLGKPQLALSHFDTALLYYDGIIAWESPLIADVLTNMGSCYLDLQELAKAKEKFLNALAIRKQVLPPTHPRMGISYATLAIVHMEEGAYQKAADYFVQVNDIMTGRYGPIHPRVADGYNSLGYCYYRLGQFDRAIKYYQEALYALNYQKGENNRFEIANGHLYLMVTLRELARCYHDLYLETNRSGSQEEAFIYIEECLALVQHVKSGFAEAASKIQLVKDAYSAYELGLDICWNNYQQVQNLTRLQQAFKYAESSKNSYLMEYLAELDARYHSAIPQKQLTKAYELESNISKFEKARFVAKKEGNDSTIQQLNEQIFDAKNELNQLKDQFKAQHSDYYNLKFEDLEPGITSIQDALEPDQAFIEYFVGDLSVYVFVVQKEHVDLKKLSLDFPLRDWVNTLCQFFYEQADKNPGVYTEPAHKLYQKIVEPLGDLPEKLIIVPDGILNYLPFEVLLSSQPEELNNFHQYNYLLHQHQIAYNFSASLWQEMKGKTAAKGPLLAIAPTFDGPETEINDVNEHRQNNLGPLLFNVEEGASIKKMMYGRLLKSENATLANFLEIAPKSSVLHLATHAKVDDTDNDFAFLAFAQGNEEQDKLYLKDLYTMELPAQMVVLSACETGLGELQRGEGVMSLARGFTYAGAKSIVTSLWAVNDQSTSMLMQAYYKNLKEGMTKDAALRQAKLSYLSEVTEAKATHPSKWGAFIVIGDMTPLEIKGKQYQWLWGLGVLLLFWLRWRRKSAA